MQHRFSLTIRRALVATLALPLVVAVAAAGGGAGAASVGELVAHRTSSNGPLRLDGVAIENFGVVDGRIFRGGQPQGRDYADLAAVGIDTVIDLRADREPGAEQLAREAGLNYINIPMVKQTTPTDDEARRFVEAVRNPANGVVYVHCAGGRHRTGSMIAVYRMVEDGWTIDQAYDEMLKFDFYTKWGHQGFKDYVFDYYKRMTSNPASVPFAFKAPAPSEVVTAAAPR